MIAQVVFLTAFVAIASAGNLGGGGYGGQGFGNGGQGLGFGGQGLGYGGQGLGGYGGSGHGGDTYAPPKYEYKYAVDDYHTGDHKQQTESRVNDFTQSDYSVYQNDRKTKVSRVIAGSVPVSTKGW